MVQNLLVKILLAPVSLLYGLGVSLRDLLYRYGLLKGVEFNLPVISVGNLSIGGAGKTPHIEYLIRLLRDYIEVATLSRGYSRKTQGYLLVEPGMTAEQAGDEPLQYKRKFPEAYVTVSESRTFGIPRIIGDHPEAQVVLLDDAFQHRSVRPGLNILLTEFNRPYTRDFLLPSGRLREWRSASSRADIIIVSKCPPDLSEADRERLRGEIRPKPHQRLYFSYYQYFAPYSLFDPDQRIELTTGLDALLISAIAGTEYLVSYLDPKVNGLILMEFEDHHYFSSGDINELKTTFNRIESGNKIILTTEKDAMRLELHRETLQKEQLPVFVLPVEVRFHGEDGERFDEDVRHFLLNFKA